MVVIVETGNPSQPMRRPITADSALMHPTSKVIALKAAVQGTTQDHLQIFNMELKSKMKSVQMTESVVFWKWVNESTLGLVTATAVYHWSMDGTAEPVKMFDRAANLNGSQIIQYKADKDGKWLVLIGIAPGAPERPQLAKGFMQLYSVEQQRSQALEAHAAAFSRVKVPGNTEESIVIAFATKSVAGGQLNSKMHVIELGAQPGKQPFAKKQADLFFPQEFADDFPVAMQISEKYGLVYVITKLGLLFVYDLETASAVYRNRISSDPIFTCCDAPTSGGFLAINRGGQVIECTVNTQAMVPFVSTQLKNLDLAMSMARRGNLPGAESLITQKFEQLMAMGQYKEAAEMAAESPQGSLRTRETVGRFQQVQAPQGQTSPLLQYFGTLLTKGALNAFESVELARLVLAQNKKQLLDTWFRENKLEPSEELGDMVKAAGDSDMAQQIYTKCGASQKALAGMAEKGDIDALVAYSEQSGQKPDYLFLLQSMMMNNPQGAVNLAIKVANMTPPPLDYNAITDLFLQRNMIREATSFLLDVLKPDLAEHAMLQTKVLEINLVTFPNVADAILANSMFTHYDRPRIAQLCEKAGLYMRALQHYTDLSDVKRVVVNTHAMDPQALLQYFGGLSPEWALECLRELMQVNARQNLQLVVNVGKEYTEQIGAEKIIALLEEFKNNEVLYFYLGSLMNTSENPDVHFKYIEAAAKTGQVKEVERVTRESSMFDPEKAKVFLMEAKLPDARPLINVCDRFGFVADLTKYLYDNSMMRYIEGYVQKVNPANAPMVVGALLDCECDESFITNLILSVRSLLPIEPLCDEVEKRNRLKLLSAFLEQLVQEGSADSHVHNALGKITIDANNNPEHFLTTNPHYDSRIVGKYCEKRDPTLACVAYKRGECDEELVDVTNRNSLFKLQSRYVVERMNPELWALVLDPENQFRRQLIDQVVSTALPESKNPEQVSITVKAFMTAELPNELIELLEKIVLQNSSFSGNPNLQNLLILTAIKADKTRVMDYINRLDAFDGPAVGEIAVGSELYEEAFAIYRKFQLNELAVKVLLENVETIERAHEFATKVDEPKVWSELAAAQLLANTVPDAIASYIRANDHSASTEVIAAARRAGCYDDMVKYLQMVRKKGVKESHVDTELAYSFAHTNQYGPLEEFISGPNAANIASVGDRCFDEGLFEAAKLLYQSVSNWGRLASTLVKLHQFQAAVDAARKANSPKTWKEVCFACVDEGEFRLAQLCGLSIIVQADELEEVSEYYQRAGKFDELLSLMEAGLGLERAHMGIYTELGILYARYKEEKLMEHLKLFANKLNIPKLIRTCEEERHWKALAYLYVSYDEHDNAANVMMQHSTTAWEHIAFKDVMVKVANNELYYKALNFYLDEHPDTLTDLLEVLKPRLDHARVVDLMRRAGQLPLIRPYLESVQPSNLVAVNDAINELCIEEEDFEGLRQSIDSFDSFDALALAHRVEKMELLEFRRIAAHLYVKNLRWRQAMDLQRKDKLYKDAMETAAQSGESDLALELLQFFTDEKKPECFAACLFTCYELIKPDVALELAWMNGMMEYVMPFVIQFVREYSNKVENLVQEKKDRANAETTAEEEAKAQAAQANMYASLLPPALPAAPGQGIPPDQMAAYQAAQQQQQMYGGY